MGYRLARVYWFVRRPRTRGAYAVVWRNGEILVIRHSYKPGLYVPGGGPSGDESPAETAARELEEEVGVKLPPAAFRRVGQIVNRRESKYDVVDVFDAEIETDPELRIDGREVVWAGFRPVESLAEGGASTLLLDLLNAVSTPATNRASTLRRL